MLERRVFSLESPEIRQDDAGARVFSGHIAVFDSLSEELFGFYERIAPQAFTRTLAEKADVRFLINHDPNLVLGRTRAGTLSLSTDAKGLVANAALPDTSYARDLATSMDRGDIDQCSFGFQVVKDEWAKEEVDGLGEVTVRTLLDVDLFDASVVTFPAYTSTDAQLRAEEMAFRYLGAVPLSSVERDSKLSVSIPSELEDREEETPAAEAAPEQREDPEAESETREPEHREEDDAEDGFVGRWKTAGRDLWNALKPGAKREGKVLSAKNRQAIEEVVGALQDFLAQVDGSEENSASRFETRADIASLEALMCMYYDGQWYLYLEDEDADQPERDAMKSILQLLSDLMVLEASEDEDGEREPEADVVIEEAGSRIELERRRLALRDRELDCELDELS